MRASGGPFIAGKIAEACGAVVASGNPAWSFDAISTDSRDIRPNDLFVALKGEDFDGHKFLIPALEAGARGCLIHRDTHRVIYQNLSNTVLIQVEDTLQALSDLASAHRSIYPTPLIAVTGSSGKTTVKEMIAAVLRRSHRPLVSQGNFNNMIGLPMTILNLGPEHDCAVVEAGINHPGEMQSLSKAASPDVAVITTVGPVHLEGLGCVETVASEKWKITTGLKPDGVLIAPAENPHCAPLLNSGERVLSVVTFGLTQGDFRAEDLEPGEGFSFTLVTESVRRRIHLKVPGKHNVLNALAALAATCRLGVPIEEASSALEEFSSPKWRMEVLDLADGRRLIRDCYNANPQSMSAALETLAQYGASEALALLGDMKELGPSAADLHRDIGALAAHLGIAKAIFVGGFGAPFAEGFVHAGGAGDAVCAVSDHEEAWSLVQPILKEYRTILVKGSRSMKMEVLADKIHEGDRS